MIDPTPTITSTLTLLGTASLIIIIAFLTSQFNPFKLSASKQSILTKLAFGIILGILAIYASLMGMKLPSGTIVNVRELAAMIAGVFGGPVGGLTAGLIGGIHRYTLAGATALPCTISTIVIGLVSGLVSTKLTGRLYLLKGAAVGFVLESFAMALILVLVPFETAWPIVQEIAIPMISANTIGLVLWLYLFNKRKLSE